MLALVLAFIGIGWHGHGYWHSLVLFVVLNSIVVGTTISLYEQWLVGRVVALCDVVLCPGGEKHGPLQLCEQMLTVAAYGQGTVTEGVYLGAMQCHYQPKNKNKS